MATTTIVDQLTELVRKSQDAALHMGRAYTDTVLAQLPVPAELPEAVDKAFGLADRVLTAQRTFTHDVLSSVLS